MNGYIFFYNGQRVEVYAAKVKAVAHFKPPKFKQHMVHGALAEKNGTPVSHAPQALAP